MMSYDGRLSVSTRRHELMEDRNLRNYFGMSFGQAQAMKNVNKFAESLSGKVDHVAKDKAKKETILPMPLWRNHYG